jgi:heme o synthase
VRRNQALLLQTSLPWREFLELCKPRVVALIIFTAIVGMFLATPDGVPVGLFISATLGIGLAAASAAVINHVADHHIDALMARTQGRPLPQGQIDKYHALLLAAVLGIVSMTLLVVFVNALTAILTLLSLIGYAVIYTLYLKHATPQNIVIGGAAGAAPPVLWSLFSFMIMPCISMTILAHAPSLDIGSEDGVALMSIPALHFPSPHLP